MRIGSDPEFFLIRDGIAIPSSLILGGSDALYNIDGVLFYVDNAAVETNINPSGNVQELISNSDKALGVISEFVGNQDATISFEPYMEFMPAYMSEPSMHVFGCMPDFCSYTDSENVIDRKRVKNGRSTGGHIHIDLHTTDKNFVLNQVALLDLYLGVNHAIMEGKAGLNRRKLYGRAGCFRFKDYGVEYRTPSCKWLSSRDLIKDTWVMVDRAVRKAAEGEVINDPDVLSAIADSINKLDKSAISFLQGKFKI